MDATPSTLPLKPKVGKNDIGCAALAIFALLVIVSLILIVVAKSGLLRIPVFSNLYHGPIPTREISVPALTAAQFQTMVGSRLQTEATTHAPPYIVTISEKELTGAMEEAITMAVRGSGWTKDRAQIAVTPQNLELLGEFHRGPWHVDLLIRFVPRVADGKLSFDPVSIHVGDYSLPAAVAYPIVSEVFSRDLGSWSLDFGTFRLQAIGLHDGELDLVTAAALPSP